MKMAEISPAFKKLDNSSTDNYRPISTLSIFTKLFERILFTQLISNDIPISIIKYFATSYCEKLASIFNDCLKENKFPNLMKIAEISPAFKKLDNASKDNYRPISTQSSFTKLFERILFMQLNRYMQSKFSKYLTGFRKNHNM